jgi:hypothetical protein
MNLNSNTLYFKQIYIYIYGAEPFFFSCSPDSIYGSENKIEAADISTGISVRVHFQMRWFSSLVAAGSITVNITTSKYRPFHCIVVCAKVFTVAVVSRLGYGV